MIHPQIKLFSKMLEIPDLSRATVFPFPESSCIEFKCGFGTPIEKIYGTLCGFLNGSGGHLIIGVEDTKRNIVGIKCSKLEDKFRLKIDEIYQQNQIVTQDGNKISIEAIRVYNIKAANNKEILVITAKPSENTKYRMRDGTVWYRLSASNYRVKNDINTYSSDEVRVLIEAEQNKTKNQLSNMRSDFDKMLGAAKEMEKKMIDMETMLHKAILLDKEKMELVLEKEKNEKSSWWSWSCC